MPTERNEPMLDLIRQVTTGVGDAQLLRNLAEDVPDMALEIRNQLRKIAASLDAAKAECASTNPTMSIPVRRESPAPSASDPTPAPATPEAQSDLVEEIDAFLAGFPNGKPAAGFRFGELLQRARDALRERDAQLAALEPVVAAARASNGLAMTRELSEAIRSLDAQERKPE